jgi:hypothetical protein
MRETNNSHTGTPAQEAQSTDQFRQLLATAISIRIQQLQATGGPTLAQAQTITGHVDQAQDAPLYPLPGPAGEDSHTIRQTTEALAVLAFIPGGIYALGLYCQASANPPVILYSSLV